MKINASLRGMPFLLAPIPLVLIAVYGAAGAKWPDDSDKKMLSIFTDLVLLSTMHGYFTLFIAFCLPAAHSWRWERRMEGRRSLPLWTGALGLVLFIFALIFLNVIAVPESFRFGSLATFELLLPLVGVQHTLWQSMGISIALSHIEVSDGTDTNRFEEQRRILRRERYLFLFMLVGAAVPLVLRWAAKYIPNWLPTRWTIEELSLASCFAMLCCLGAMLFNLNTAAIFSWRRGAYLLRLLSWAVVPISPYGFYASAGIHGIEYAFLLSLFIGPRATRPVFVALAVWIAVGIAVRAGTFAYWEYDFGTGTIWLGILAALGQTVTLLHYHLDRELFTMRRPENRRFAGAPLLKVSQ